MHAVWVKSVIFDQYLATSRKRGTSWNVNRKSCVMHPIYPFMGKGKCKGRILVERCLHDNRTGAL